MKLLVLVFTGLVGIVPHAYTTDTFTASGFPSEVNAFKKRRDLCDHFRGEEPYDKERRKFIEESLKQYCTGTDKELASLKNKYKHNEAVLRALSDYEITIE